jgi:hypothetical protein
MCGSRLNTFASSLWAISIFIACGLLLFSHPVYSTPESVSTEAIGRPDALNDAARPRPKQILYLTFALTSSGQQKIAEFDNSLTDPLSPNYHHWITPTEFGQKFGATDDNLNTVVNYLAKSGLTGITIWPDRLFVSAQGPRDVVESAFNVTIHGYNRSEADRERGLTSTYFAPDREPSVDASIAPLFSGVFGLSSAVERTPASRVSLADPMVNSTTGALDPPDLAKAYNITSLHNDGLFGQGETIAIFSPTAYQASDISTFLANNDITSANINIINVDGGTNDLSGQEEACIDIETTVGQAPDAKIDVYEGPNTSSNFDIFEQIEKDDPNILSESWGTYEDEVNSSFASSYETIREAMAAEGISIFVASGDNGVYDPSTHKVSVSVDASSAYVTAVGGTELTLSDGEWDGEVAWSYNDGTTSRDSGSGGGLSIYYPVPEWQTGPGVSNSSSDGHRQVPDVSALASTPYYDIYTEGAYQAFGGTSCPAPLWAATMSLIEQNLGSRIGNVNPTLYNLGSVNPSVYHDITSGNDGLYDCTPGWDFVTGWGSANFGSLLAAFGGITPTISAFTPSSGAAGTLVTITGTNLSNALSVTFGGVASTIITSDVSTQIVAFVPTGAVTGTISVTTSQGTATSASVFTVSSAQTAPTPTISPDGGTFTSSQTVTITDSNSSAHIYYTVNGTTPTVNSTPYAGNIIVTSSETINAVAVVSSEANSAVASAVFLIGQSAPTPTISPDGGTFSTAQAVAINDAQSGLTIYYTLNGTTPTTASAVYTGPITVETSETLEAIAAGGSYSASLPAIAVFTIAQPTPAPTIMPQGGTFSSAVTVTITDSSPNASIYYTVNGSTPTSSSTPYTSAITVSTSETISAVAIAPNESISAITTAAFTITQAAPLPVFNPPGGTYTTTQTVTITDGVSSAVIYYTTNGTTPTGSSSVYTGPITVFSSETVEAIAVAPGFIASGVSLATYTIVKVVETVPAPIISPDGGTFSGSQTVTISDSNSSAAIYYTINGTPTTSSTRYTGPITVSSSETISAIATAPGFTNSGIVSATFTITPFVSFAAGLQMFSLPYSYAGVSLDTIFRYSGVTLAVWNPAAYDYTLTPNPPANQIVAGQGYWVRFPSTVSVTLTGTPTPTNAPFVISLSAGWNMIGDPFTSSVPLSSVTFDGTETLAQASGGPNPLVSSEMYTFTSGSSGYSSSSTLSPDQGYWIFAFSATTMSIPPP